jgi:hypothetical protein
MTVSTPLSAPCLAARHRGVEKAAALGGAGFGQFARDFGGSGGVVDQDGAFFMPLRTPSGPSVTARRSSSLPTQVKTKSAPFAASEAVSQAVPPNSSAHFAGLGRRAVVDPDFVAALGLEVTRHGVAHHAKTDECYCRHFAYPFVTNALYA